MSPEFQEALQAEALRLAALGDSIDVVRAVGDFFAQLDFELEQVADVRKDAIRQLRQAGWTYTRISEASGLSLTRVAQLAQATATSGRISTLRAPD